MGARGHSTGREEQENCNELGQAEGLQLEDDLGREAPHVLDGNLVAQPVGAFTVS